MKKLSQPVMDALNGPQWRVRLAVRYRPGANGKLWPYVLQMEASTGEEPIPLFYGSTIAAVLDAAADAHYNNDFR